MGNTNLNQPGEQLLPLQTQQPQSTLTQEPQTVDALDTMIAQTQQNVKVRVWSYVVLSLVFPPFTTIWAFYKASKKQVLSQVLPAITIAFSLLVLFSAITSLSSVSVPSQLAKLGVTSQTGVSQSALNLLVGLTIILGLVGLVGGYYFRRKVEKTEFLSSFAKVFMIAIVILQMAAITYLFYFVYKSAYANIAPLMQNSYQGIQ